MLQWVAFCEQRRMRWRSALSIAVAGLSIQSSPADAQAISCYSREKVAHVLRTRHGERWVAHGTTQDDGWRYEFWSTKDGSQWTLFVSRAQGVSRLACILASGKNWKAVGNAWKPKP